MPEVIKPIYEWVKTNLSFIIVLAMPLTYGFVGWFTNWVALKMTFYPLAFHGIPPYLGWQGIIPRKAHKMASKSVDIITERLLNVEEVFNKIDPNEVEKELKPILEEVTENVVRDVVDDINPDLWNILPQNIREQILINAASESSNTIQRITADLRKNIYNVFDLKELVLKNLTGQNVSLIVEMFQSVGAPEFRFIERSGFYFGFLLGLVQVAIWFGFSVMGIPESAVWWTLPIQGVVVGYVTNWLALKMIFRPQEEKQIGPFKYQGLFHRRQDSVSKQYAHLVATRILTPKKIMAEILYGRAGEEVLNVVRRSVVIGVESASNLAKPLISLAMGEERYESIKTYIVAKFTALAPNTAVELEEYLEKAMDLEDTMYTRMRKLTKQEFEIILRSAFQEDELLLILVGAFLGAVVGLLQGLYYI